MSILGSIFGKIFGRRDKDDDKAAPNAMGKTAPPAGGKTLPDQTPVAIGEADVEAILTKLVQSKGQPSNWRTSIVDLMKLLDIDSSLENRKALADELGYAGDKSDSASMNIWLHRQVMNRLAQNGGRVPADLID